MTGLAPWRVLLWGLVLLLVATFGGWWTLLRPVALPATNDPIQRFNYGSIGNEASQGLPYWIWRVLPVVFADHLPGAGKGYAAVGIHWERGRELPVGFTKKTLGVIPRVAPNCAFCHQGSYRLHPEAPATLVTAGAGNRVDPQAYIRFLAAAGSDPRFTADRLMAEIEAIYEMPLWERLLYRYLLIPATRSALVEQGERFAWTTTRPDWGPGRIDPFNPVKFGQLGLADDDTIGNSDMMPLWRLHYPEIEAERGIALHWDGLLGDLHETAVAGAIGDGMNWRSYAEVDEDIARLTEFIRRQGPPPSPFSPHRAPTDPFRVDGEAAAAGRLIFRAECAMCHAPDGARFRTVVPHDEIGTDRHRIDMWTEAARDRYAAYEPGYDWGFRSFAKHEGYVATELTGLWLRGPYLHNGSVPTLRDMLRPPERRPERFWRGYDLLDARNGGFVSGAGTPAERLGWLYDTRQPGNGNGGHPYGTLLPPDMKEDLLAYLKTL